MSLKRRLTGSGWLLKRCFGDFLVLTEWARTCSPPQSEEVRLFIHLGTIIARYQWHLPQGYNVIAKELCNTFL